MKYLFRSLTEPAEILENSPGCGRLSEAKSPEVIQKLREDQCLSTCTWKTNPFFKLQPRGPLVHYGIKWYERYFTDENTFPQLHDSPMVPEDLGCLSSCFDKYKQGSDLLTAIQRKCSAIGIDRQIPTHLRKGEEMVESKFFKIFPNDCETTPCLAARIFNPNLDCLIYYETKERIGCGSDGVCNFIPGSPTLTEPGNDVGLKLQGFSELIQNKSHSFAVSGTSTYTTRPNVYTEKILRSSSPVIRALKLCALAKLIQFYREGGNEYYSWWTQPTLFDSQEVHGLFSGDHSTCDKFMPDIFKSLCPCAGTCAPPGYNPTSEDQTNIPDNLLYHFETDNGLWECQDACRNNTACRFYTHSSFSKYFPRSNYDIFHCFLWRSCSDFNFSQEDVYPGTWDTYPDVSISIHWTGRQYCSVDDPPCPCCEEEGVSYQVKK